MDKKFYLILDGYLGCKFDISKAVNSKIVKAMSILLLDESLLDYFLITINIIFEQFSQTKNFRVDWIVIAYCQNLWIKNRGVTSVYLSHEEENKLIELVLDDIEILDYNQIIAEYYRL